LKHFKDEVKEFLSIVYETKKRHGNVNNSPILYDTLLIKAPGSNQKTQVGKLLLSIPVRELHNKMVSAVIDGGLVNA
jgi:hypothetical protein